MSKSNQINIHRAVNEAFNGFKNWWFPLCGITAAIFLSQAWLPHFLFKNILNEEKINSLKITIEKIKDKAIATGDPDTALNQLKMSIIHLYNSPEVHTYFNTLFFTTIFVLLIIAFILCFLYITVIIISKNAVRTNKKNTIKKNLRKSHLLSCSYFFLSITKATMLMLPFLIPILYLLTKLGTNTILKENSIPTFLIFYHILELIGIFILTVSLVSLSIYVYIRFYFTGFIITEKSANPFFAISQSWALTKNNTNKLFIIFVLTIIIDIISIASIIGFIPGTGLKYTLRASAYRQSLDNKREKNEKHSKKS
jgi:hypothetical protein